MMALLPITLIGDKILRHKTTRVTDVDMDTVELIKDMFDTLKNAHGIGLAANQVGSDKAIFILNLNGVEDYEKFKPTVIINPEITFRSEEKVFMEEGCLSIPDIRLEVERPEKVILKYQDTELKPCEIKADSLLARVIQHEFDHLQGVFFTDLVEQEQKKRIRKPINRIRSRKIEVDYPVTEDSEYRL